MTLAVIYSRALVGLLAPEVQVEVHLANGLPGFTLVGLADTEVKEARERVRAALAESGFAFPHNRRITVNLAPADLPKEFLIPCLNTFLTWWWAPEGRCI
jgi:magnesium chelatase family protein